MKIDPDDLLFLEVIAAEIQGKTNKTRDAVFKEYEADYIAVLPDPPNLKNCTPSSMKEHVFDPVAIPPGLEDFIQSLTLPLSKEDQSLLEKIVAEFNGVPPDEICCTRNLIIGGKGWIYNPTHKLTGFEYIP